MLINLSNHESGRWSTKQKQAAEQLFGEVRDFPFPAIDPAASVEKIIELAQSYLQSCQFMILQSVPQAGQSAIHVMGEMTFVYQFVKLSTVAGLRCVASTTERIAVDHPDGSKTSEFRFVQFRDYEQKAESVD
jgi:hypothetical protein